MWMSRIESAFERGKAFIGFLTGGDPDLETTEKLIYAMERGGADIIEVGIPFSDPVAEGVVIQAANERALRNGCTTDKIFDMVKKVRANSNIPLVLLTYLNPIYTYGKDKFFQRCREALVDGIIVPDLPFEEREELLPDSQKYEITLISLISPTSNERIGMIAKEAKGFLYCVSSLGVTGVRENMNTDMNDYVRQIKEYTNIPCAIGFGIATPKQAKELASYFDGIIVGSEIVKIIEKEGRNSEKSLYEYISNMKNAMQEIE